MVECKDVRLHIPNVNGLNLPIPSQLSHRSDLHIPNAMGHLIIALIFVSSATFPFEAKEIIFQSLTINLNIDSSFNSTISK